MELSIADIANGMAQGQIELTGVATSPDDEGDTWTPIDLASAGGRWISDQGGNRQPLESVPGRRTPCPSSRCPSSSATPGR